MTDIGKFRAVDAKDLREFAYGGESKLLEADLANLRRQGLIAEREIPHQETAPLQLVALTKQGHRLLVATKNTTKDQTLYHGFTKPREAHHDPDLYRLYQRGLERIAREAGTNIRVILDSEPAKEKAEHKAAHHAVSVTGCLQKGDEPGEFSITGADSKTWDLRSRSVKLAEHVGHKVTVTGFQHHESKAEEAKEEKMEKDKEAAGKGENADLRVTSLKMVSNSCGN